jgi:bifunctional non-homologous end joining protein LigD
MLYPFSLPTRADKVPVGRDWIHEIKYVGYRMLLIREQDRVRLISGGGYDWAPRFPLTVAAVLKLRRVVVLDKDGVSDFDALASRKHDKRRSSIPSICSPETASTSAGMRSRLVRLVSSGCSRVRSTASSSQNTNKAKLATFNSTACNMGLEGIVCKPMAPATAIARSRSRTPRCGVQQSQGQTPSVTLFAQIRIVHAARILGAAENHDNENQTATVIAPRVHRDRRRTAGTSFARPPH